MVFVCLWIPEREFIIYSESFESFEDYEEWMIYYYYFYYYLMAYFYTNSFFIFEIINLLFYFSYASSFLFVATLEILKVTFFLTLLMGFLDFFVYF
jgi:hypothetical protein